MRRFIGLALVLVFSIASVVAASGLHVHAEPAHDESGHAHASSDHDEKPALADIRLLHCGAAVEHCAGAIMPLRAPIASSQVVFLELSPRWEDPARHQLQDDVVTPPPRA